MNFSSFFFLTALLGLFNFSLADDEVSYMTTTITQQTTTITTTTEAPTPTLVWATGYDENGELQTTQSVYTQSFAKFYTKVASVPTGSIGLGNIKGTVGTLRKYPSQTLKVAPANTKR